MAKKPRNRKAQDLTLVNLQALKKKLAALTLRVKALEVRSRIVKWEPM